MKHAQPNRYLPEVSFPDQRPMIRLERPKTVGCGSILAQVSRNFCRSFGGVRVVFGVNDDLNEVLALCPFHGVFWKR